MTLTRKLVFGLIAVVVIPALFYLLLEQGLRVLGYGKSYDYFNKITIDGREYFQDNPAFIEQFYPASLDIKTLEATFSADQEQDTVRIFVLGGSAARGFPNPEHGFSRQLEALLTDALPDRKVEVINTAMTAINSHVVYETARSIPEGSADFAIVLMGNNEVIGPYGPGTYNQGFLSNLGLIRALQAFKRSRIGQLLINAAATMNPRDHREELKWKGMQMFTNESVSHDDPRLATVYRHYRSNLQDIVDTLQDKGARVILSSVPVNLRHSAPFASVHRPDLTEAQLAQWTDATGRGDESYDRQDWTVAVDNYRAALAIDPEFADTHFRLAASYEKSGRPDLAAEHYDQARDLDALRFRADSQINRIVRDVAAEYAGDQLTFADSVATFSGASEPMRPGWNLFLEHVHYNFSGDYLLAREFAGAILQALGMSDYRPLRASALAERIGYPSNMTIKVMDRVVSMVKSPPFTGQSNHAELETLIVSERDRIETELGTVQEQIDRRLKTLQSGKGDWRLRYELAYLYEHLKNRPATYRQLQRLYSEYPHHRDSLVMTAKMLHQDERYREAIPYLRLALIHARDEDALIAQLTGWLGLAHLKLGEKDTATELLLRVPREYPEQIHYVLQAYATLIRYSVQAGDTDATRDYAEDVQRYAERADKGGKAAEYPMLYTRMSQIMRLAGDQARAQDWKQRGQKRAIEQRAGGA